MIAARYCCSSVESPLPLVEHDPDLLQLRTLLGLPLLRLGNRRDEGGGPPIPEDLVRGLPGRVQLPMLRRILVRRVQDRPLEEPINRGGVLRPGAVASSRGRSRCSSRSPDLLAPSFFIRGHAGGFQPLPAKGRCDRRRFALRTRARQLLGAVGAYPRRSEAVLYLRHKNGPDHHTRWRKPGRACKGAAGKPGSVTIRGCRASDE